MIVTGKIPHRCIVFLIGAAVMLHPAALFGYVPPPAYLIEQMVSGMGLPQQFRVEQSLHVRHASVKDMDGEALTESPVYGQTLQYRLPGTFRSDISGHGISRVHVSTPDESITVIDDVVISRSEEWLYGYTSLFLYQDRKGLTRRLKEMGVDVNVSSLGRLDGAIYYVIGAQYPDNRVPQLWIDRDDYKPVRLVLEGSESDSKKAAREVRFSNWRQFNGMRYPGEIHFFEHGTEIQKVTVEQVNVNPVFETAAFDIHALKSLSNDDPADGNDLDFSDEIQREIEAFKRIYE